MSDGPCGGGSSVGSALGSALIGAALIGSVFLGSACTSTSAPAPGSAPGSGTGPAGTGRSTAPALAGGAGEAPTPSRSVARSPRPSPTRTRSGPAVRVREKPGPCPYLSDQRAADLEGTRVGRSTVLTSTPVGCRFYYAYDETEPTMELTIAKYASATAAFNRVARTGGSSAFGTPGIGAGAVLYRTRFRSADGDRDWACSFAKGSLVVTVRTGQTKSSTDARNVARAVVDRI